MLKQKLLTGWNIPRFLRLGIGLWLLIVTIQARNWPAALFSGLIVFMAVSIRAAAAHRAARCRRKRTQLPVKLNNK